MLRNLGGPYAPLGIRFCPTGGLNLDNVNDYLALPSVSCIGGSWLAARQQIADKQWDEITAQAKAAVEKAKELC
jgi:2-dehydro-3-deoxyphosphogluconate aldolase/(4S)-4-hydroxy-2-oxoglutarate aldolase